MRNSKTPNETPNYTLNTKLLRAPINDGDLETDDIEASSPDRLLGSRITKRNYF